MKKADLHMHSYFSDGDHSPEELVIMAKQAGLCCIALTDHDTAKGNKALLEAGKKHDFEVIPGIEITCKRGDIIGLFIDSDHPALARVTEGQHARETEQVKQIIENLKKAGFDISLQDIKKKYPRASPEIVHIVEVFVEKGYGDDFRHTYDAYFAKGKGYHVPREDAPLEESISAIREAGGVVIIPHPWLSDYRYFFENIDRLIKLGVVGIEDETSQYKPDNYEEVAASVRELCKKKGLIILKGTDFHKENIGAPIGTIFCDYSVVQEIKKRLGK
jgi:predicted metal-dependent phosphoesterase TrpH